MKVAYRYLIPAELRQYIESCISTTVVGNEHINDIIDQRHDKCVAVGFELKPEFIRPNRWLDKDYRAYLGDKYDCVFGSSYLWLHRCAVSFVEIG